MTEGIPANVSLVKTTDTDDPQHLLSLLRTSTNSNGVDTLSRTVFLPLNEGDEIHIENVGSLVYSSETERETAFSGFQYKPAAANVSLSSPLSSSLYNSITIFSNKIHLFLTFFAYFSRLGL